MLVIAQTRRRLMGSTARGIALVIQVVCRGRSTFSAYELAQLGSARLGSVASLESWAATPHGLWGFFGGSRKRKLSQDGKETEPI